MPDPSPDQPQPRRFGCLAKVLVFVVMVGLGFWAEATIRGHDSSHTTTIEKGTVVIRNGRIADHRHGEPEHPRLKAAHESGRGAAITSGQPCDQRLVGCGEHTKGFTGLARRGIARRSAAERLFAG
jgi:hypothetical protein